MTDDLAPKIRSHIAELEELLRQLRAGEADMATKLSIDRVEQSLGLFRDMLNDVIVKAGKV